MLHEHDHEHVMPALLWSDYQLDPLLEITERVQVALQLFRLIKTSFADSHALPELVPLRCQLLLLVLHTRCRLGELRDETFGLPFENVHTLLQSTKVTLSKTKKNTREREYRKGFVRRS